MSRASILAAGRRAAEAGMVDTCRIRRTIQEDTDESTGVITPVKVDIYAGPCRIQQAQGQGQRQDVAEASLVLLRLELQLPMSVIGLQEGDEAEILTSVNDGDLVGRVFRIRDLAHKTEATARRVQCMEVTS